MNLAPKTIKVYDEIVDFIASGTTPQSVIDFHLSETAQERLEDLVYSDLTLMVSCGAWLHNVQVIRVNMAWLQKKIRHLAKLTTSLVWNMVTIRQPKIFAMLAYSVTCKKEQI